MKTLSTEHRRQLERAVVNAREVAETGARAALEALAVDGRDPFEHMSEEQRALRRRLRAHARHLGDRMDGRSGAHGIDHLTHECAYEQWHAMLFARFLAENHLLIEPEFAVPITLDECEELSKAKERTAGRWPRGLPTACCRRCSGRTTRCSGSGLRASIACGWRNWSKASRRRFSLRATP